MVMDSIHYGKRSYLNGLLKYIIVNYQKNIFLKKPLGLVNLIIKQIIMKKSYNYRISMEDNLKSIKTEYSIPQIKDLRLP